MDSSDSAAAVTTWLERMVTIFLATAVSADSECGGDAVHVVDCGAWSAIEVVTGSAVSDTILTLLFRDSACKKSRMKKVE